jgi:hypothetical protein
MKEEVTEVFFGFLFSVVRRMEFRLQSAWALQGFRRMEPQRRQRRQGSQRRGEGFFSRKKVQRGRKKGEFRSLGPLAPDRGLGVSPKGILRFFDASGFYTIATDEWL